MVDFTVAIRTYNRGKRIPQVLDKARQRAFETRRGTSISFLDDVATK